jgi:ATP-dependent helicase HrpB
MIALPDLPVTELLDPLRQALSAQPSVILEAPPGAGKTTLVPLALLHEPWLEGRRILMLQPRRIATRNAAARMAGLLGEAPGQTVGYRMRLDTKVSPATRIEVITEGVLRRMLSDDPTLEGVGLVIFDEFHERSLDADLSLALALFARDTFPEDARFRMLIMSATLAGLPLETYLQAPVLRSEGRQFPVDTVFGKAAGSRERVLDRLPALLASVAAKHPNSSVLVFLPGQGEIRRLAAELDLPADVQVLPLYGDLSLQEQQRAIAPAPRGRRKVVLATNVAETSLTIDGVDVVVDAGLERIPEFDPATAMTRLATVRISRASAEQRRGRAGRLRPGTCYRLWSETQHEQLAAQADPEIAGADLAPVVLELLAWGATRPEELRWLTPPPGGAWDQAVELLRGLAAVTGEGGNLQLTEHGRRMAALPVHPRLAHMLLAGLDAGAADTASLIAAVLSDRDPLSRESGDMQLRLDYLQEQQSVPASLRGWETRTRTLAAQLRRRLPEPAAITAITRPRPEQRLGFLIACAYPDRVARRRHSGGYQLANGRSADFEGTETLAREKWLAVAEVGGLRGRGSDRIRSAAGLDPALFEAALAHLVEDVTRAEWSSGNGRFEAVRERRIGALLLTSERVDDPPEDTRLAGLLALLRENSLKHLPWSENNERLRQRAQLMQRLQEDWPDFSMQGLCEGLDEWLAPFLAPVRRLADLKKVDLAAALRARLSWEQQQRLDIWLPERMDVPSGSSIRIDYAENPPVLAVKLQEMFGCTTTPTLAEGRVKLTVHLLSPAGRPLQVTQDLAGFWSGSYEAVKKEMKGRYPKHPWPDDPMAAPPTRHTKQRSAKSP